jgi:[protein-PII] uridylyltransferase
MTVSGANIVDARIFTTSDGMAVDVFWLQDDNGEPIAGETALKRLSKRVEQVMSGEIKLSQALRQRRGKLPTRAQVFTVEPLIVFDNEASNTHTVIEVNARDRPALLHDLTRACFDLSLTIAHARIATYGERAVDVFYVKDLFGMKVTHPGKRKAIEARLRQAIDRGAERAKEDAKARDDRKAEPARARRPAA